MIDPAILALVIMLVSGGTSTVLLRLSVLTGGADGARFYRASLQTVFIVVSIAIVYALGGTPGMDIRGGTFAALNGVFGGIAFILFTAGLEDVEASTAKPTLVLSMLVAVVLGIVLLAEPLSLRKIAGITLAIIAVYLLSR